MALFINRFPLFCPAILEQRSRQRPRTRPFVLDKTERKPYNLLKHIAGTSDLVFCLPRVGVQRGACGTPPSSHEMESPVHVQTLRKKDNQNGHIIFYLCGLSTTCREAAHIEQSERSGTLHIEWAKAHISSGHRPHIDIKLIAGTNNQSFRLVGVNNITL